MQVLSHCAGKAHRALTISDEESVMIEIELYDVFVLSRYELPNAHHYFIIIMLCENQTLLRIPEKTLFEDIYEKT